MHHRKEFYETRHGLVFTLVRSVGGRETKRSAIKNDLSREEKEKDKKKLERYEQVSLKKQTAKAFLRILNRSNMRSKEKA